jgi:hypothetical protein
VIRPKKKRLFKISAAFLVVCLILIGLILVRETWKFRRLQTLNHSLLEFHASHLSEVILFKEPFDDTSLTSWKEEVRSGHTRYSVQREEGENSFLRAQSDKAASLLVRKFPYDPRRYPYLKWRWRVEEMVPEADMRTLSGSDAPARVYVAFYNGFGVWNVRLVNYVWASSMKSGTAIQSFLSPNSRILVLESGYRKGEEGKWVEEERNVLEDYRSLFGEDPQGVEAIALMTDSDNTRSVAAASYDDIIVSNQP